MRELNSERSPQTRALYFSHLPKELKAIRLASRSAETEGGWRGEKKENCLSSGEEKRIRPRLGSLQARKFWVKVRRDLPRALIAPSHPVSRSREIPLELSSGSAQFVSSKEAGEKKKGEGEEENLRFSRAAQSNGANIYNPGTRRGLAPT